MSKVGMEYIRRYYNVPAKRGGRVRYTGDRTPKLGTITGTQGPHLVIRLDGERGTDGYHPMWELEYLESDNDRS